MTGPCEVAIIGAGPFGLSISAHLTARKLPHRIFGRAMETWATQMPKGMQLKSDGFATDIYEPGGSISFGRFCREHAIEYADLGIPPRLDDFVAYGLAFQRAVVPHLEERLVTGLEQDGSRFRLTFAQGPACLAGAVVVAAGIAHFASLPKVFAGLPQELVTHSSRHRELGGFRGKKVAVIGAGSSAADLAALLHEEGAEVHLIARGGAVPFHTKMRLPRPLYDRLRWPASVIGPSWRSLFYTKAPLLFRRLPLSRRLQLVRSELGPVGGYFMRDRVIGRVAIHLGLEAVGAEPDPGGGILLTLANNGGEQREFRADHVICATGYQPELARLPFLERKLLARIAAVEGTPVLSSHFESSVPGLYFAGAIAANDFGPLVRFACGARFAAARVSRHLAWVRFRRRCRSLFGSKAAPSMPGEPLPQDHS